MPDLELPSPLVSAEWLLQNHAHPNLVILDATIPKVGQAELPEEAQSRQIAGARFFDLKNRFSDPDAALPNTMPSPERFSEGARALGLGPRSVVVCYDHHGVYSSPRAWWMFRAMGHARVAVLDGGFAAWKNTGGPAEDRRPYPGPAGGFTADYQPERITDAQGVLDALNRPGTAILDARPEPRFSAAAPEPRAHLRGGHIPGSKNLPSSAIVRNGKMLPADQLQEVYRGLGLSPDQKQVFSCGSGITACVIALGAELAGHRNTSVYDGSWSEWGANHAFPVEK